VPDKAGRALGDLQDSPFLPVAFLSLHSEL
jgi:hypothetical protein